MNKNTPEHREEVAYQEITVLSKRLDSVVTKALVAFANRCERRGLDVHDVGFVTCAAMRVAIEENLDKMIESMEENIYEEEST